MMQPSRLSLGSIPFKPPEEIREPPVQEISPYLLNLFRRNIRACLAQKGRRSKELSAEVSHPQECQLLVEEVLRRNAHLDDGKVMEIFAGNHVLLPMLEKIVADERMKDISVAGIHLLVPSQEKVRLVHLGLGQYTGRIRYYVGLENQQLHDFILLENDLCLTTSNYELNGRKDPLRVKLSAPPSKEENSLGGFFTEFYGYAETQGRKRTEEDFEDDEGE